MRDRLPRTLLRAEGAAVAVAAAVLYFHAGYPWWLLIALVLAPDLSMIGYLGGSATGAVAYDLAHTTVWPILLGALGLLAGSDLPVELALIWLVHIGVDRAVGYGLKYPAGFEETHLQRV
jgi:hypothetical protein